jgi:hypothetical protein
VTHPKVSFQDRGCKVLLVFLRQFLLSHMLRKMLLIGINWYEIATGSQRIVMESIVKRRVVVLIIMR